MRKTGRRFFAGIMVLLMLTALIPAYASADTYEVSRVINLVYDDSTSMIIDDYTGKPVDRWCQAKYGMEVFAAMLGSRDTLNIFCMSDYYYGTGGINMTLRGSDGAEKNVDKVHNMLTKAGWTPFAAVTAAEEDLRNRDADEKWLVILTDGEFQNRPRDLNSYFAGRNDDTKVMFIGLSDTVDNITQNEQQGIYFSQAHDSREILGILTDAANRIFNSNKLTVSRDGSFSFDLPMSELVVFAQGKNVAINGITDSAGNRLSGEIGQVSVRYSEKATSNSAYKESDTVVAKNLTGKIATFRGDYGVGNYKLDVTGAETVEIYYRPNVDIGLILTDSSGFEVTSLQKLEAGEYTVDFSFVKKGTEERVPESPLLGDVVYKASMSNNGAELGEIKSGQKIKLDEGDVTMDASATYLVYNTVSTSVSYKVWRNKTVSFSFPSDNPTYYVVKDGVTLIRPPMAEKEEDPGVLDYIKLVIDGLKARREQAADENVTRGGETVSAPYTVKVKLNGQDVTEEQWAIFATPTVRLRDRGVLFSSEGNWFERKLAEIKYLFSKKEDANIFRDAVVEKTDEPGVFLIYPTVRDDGPEDDGTEYTNAAFLIEYSEQVDEELWSGRTEGSIKVKDCRSFYDRNAKVIIGWLKVAGILLLIFLYVIKPRFPKEMAEAPLVTQRKIGPEFRGMRLKPSEDIGSFEKSFLMKILPLVAERGTIYIPQDGSLTLHVKAKRGGREFWLMNAESFAGNKKILFDGEPLDEETTTGPTALSSATEITYTTERDEYKCSLCESADE